MLCIITNQPTKKQPTNQPTNKKMKTAYKSPIQGVHPNLVKIIQEAENYTFENTATTTKKTKNTKKTNFSYKTKPKTPTRTPSPRIDVSNCQRILVFDTETTGFPPSDDELYNLDNLDNVDFTLMSYITQLSYVIYDTKMQNIVNIFNEYIDIPQDVVITTKITNITGIDRDTLDKKGIPMIYALNVFLQNLEECDCVVGHNVLFDVKMIQLEMMRYYGKCQTGIFNNTIQYCTMHQGVSICKLVTPKTKTGNFKPPKLCELYSHYFQETVENLHNSIVDVLVCFRCFLKMEFDSHIPSDIFGEIIDFGLTEV